MLDDRDVRWKMLRLAEISIYSPFIEQLEIWRHKVRRLTPAQVRSLLPHADADIQVHVLARGPFPDFTRA